MNAVNFVRVPLYCLLSLSLVLPGCCFQWDCGDWLRATHERAEDLSTPISPDSTLSAKTDVGSITVTGSGTAECSLHATIKAKARTSERAVQLAEETTVELNHNDNAVEVKINKPHIKHWECVSVDLKIETPQQIHPDCAANVGEVRISDITGKIKAVSNVGKIVCTNVSNQLQLKVDVGGIRVKCFDNPIRALQNRHFNRCGRYYFRWPS